MATSRPHVFAEGFPKAPAARWQLVRAFAERWCGARLPSNGARDTNVRSLAIREWLALGRELEAAGQPLRDGTPSLASLEEHAATSILLQAEGDLHWAVRNDAMSLADPPVYTFVLDYEGDRPEQFITCSPDPEHSSLSAFAIDYLASYMHTAGGGMTVEIGDAPASLTRLRSTFSSHAELDGAFYFESDDLLVRVLPPRPRLGGWHLDVQSLTRDRDGIPAFLLERARNGGAFSGVFIEERNR